MPKYLCYQIHDYTSPVETDAPTPEGAAVLASTITKTAARWVVVDKQEGGRDFTTSEQRTYLIVPDDSPF